MQGNALTVQRLLQYQSVKDTVPAQAIEVWVGLLLANGLFVVPKRFAHCALHTEVAWSLSLSQAGRLGGANNPYFVVCLAIFPVS